VGRPRTPIGTFGEITVREIAPKVHEANARFRMRDGRYRRVYRRASSAKAATRALKAAMATLADEVSGRAISGDSRFGHVLDLWLADFEQKVERGDRAAKSLYDYRDSTVHLKKRMGELTCREAENAGLCDEVLKAIRDEIGHASAKRAKTVLSGVCGYAVRHNAMRANPAKSVEALSKPRSEKEPIRALEAGQRRDFLTKLRAWTGERVRADQNRLGPRAKAWTDLPDIAEAMLATGTRIGEILAVTGDEVDPAAQTVAISHHLVRIAGQGIVRQPLRKGGGVALTLKVPSWSLPMFRRRKLESGGGALFPTWNGGWVDPSNVTKRIRTACDEIGYPWVSSHIWRHTVATHLGDSDVAPTAIADQLGNTAEVVERNYRRKRIANEDIARSLESLMGEEGTG
jgi:integrase